MKRFLDLSNAQKEELSQRLSTEKRTKIYKRLVFIDLKSQHCSNTEIQSQLSISPNTCSNWLTLFLSSGFPGLCWFKYDGRRPWKLEEYKETIKKHIDTEIVPTLTHLKAWISQEFSISIQESWLGEWCKKNWIALTRSSRSSQESSNQEKYKKHS